MRGRLINPFLAEIAQLDVAATAADPDGAGPLTSGYDPDFKETLIVADNTGHRLVTRREKPPIQVPCQVEVTNFGELQEMLGGNSPKSHLILVFHFLDLERMGLVDAATGEASFQVGDRLVSIRDYNTGELVQAIRTPPGLYITEVQSQSFGIGVKRNLLFVMFDERALGAKSS